MNGADQRDASPVDDVLTTQGFHGWGENPPPLSTIEEKLQGLAASKDYRDADELRRAMLREGALQAVKDAKVNRAAPMVDAALKPAPGKKGEQGHGQALALQDPEPWPDPVDGGDLLVELVKVFPRYLALPAGASTVLALWTLHCHAHDAATVSPLLGITSPQKRCGKTTTLSLLGGTVPRPLSTSNITGPALFRSVERWAPTLLVDEAESFLRDREDLRGILNSGHHRAGAFVVRTVGDDHEARLFTTWCPKAIALIGKLPDTLMDRSIEISMRRRGAGEKVERHRLDRLADLEPLRRKAWTWARDHMEELKGMDPTVPTGLHDRAADNWRPLLAIAETIGGVWPERARKAAALLSGQAEDDEAGTLLLVDLKSIFTTKGVDRIFSAEITKALVDMEDRPWPEWRRGSPLTTRQLARLLKPFGIGPKKIRIGDSVAQGYLVEDFTDAFSRYTPSGLEQAEQPNKDGPSPCFSIRNMEGSVPDPESTENPITAGIVPDVPDGRRESGRETLEPRRRFSETTAGLFEELAK